MHGDHGVPVLVGHVEQHAVTRDARIVDDDAQAAETVGRGHQLIGRRPCADVTGDRDGFGPRGDDLVDDVGLVQGARDVVDHDRGPRSRQADGLCAAQPRGRAGHDRDQAGQISRICSHL